MVKQQGFSLLEAIVALTILAGASMALFGWIGASINQLQRAEQYTKIAPAMDSCVSFLSRANLSVQPSGVCEYSGVTIRWQSSPIEMNATKMGEMGGSNFFVSLYEVALTPSIGLRTYQSYSTRIVNFELKPGVGDVMNAF